MNFKKFTVVGAAALAAVVSGVTLTSCGKKLSEPIKVAIPSDGTNLSRGIKLLESAGLITVNPEAGYTPQISDITGYLYNIEVVPQDADTLPTLLADYGAATINGTYATPAGLVPSRDGLIIEKQSESGDNPYVNIIAARTADKDNEIYRTVVEAYQSQEVAEFILNKYQEAYYPSFDYTENPNSTIVSTVENYTSTITYTTTVKVGVCGASNEQWDAVQYVLDQKYASYGIKIQTVVFSAYNLPNDALNSGEIDLNAFQHKAYLNNDKTKNGYAVESIGDTLIAPLTLYSNKYKTLDALKDAAGKIK